MCAPPWPPKKNTLFVTNFQCGKAFFLGGQGGAKRMCKIASCNSQMSGTYIQKPYPHFKKMHAKRWWWKVRKTTWSVALLHFILGQKLRSFTSPNTSGWDSQSKICVYCKRYTRVFVNPCKPFAHALPGIMISSRRQLFLSYIHVCQPWLSANVVCTCHWLQQNEF